MLRAIAAGHDLHDATASDVFKVPIESVTTPQRQSAKGVNFTLTYGGSAWTIAMKNGITETEAEVIFNAFFERNPEARVWMRQVQQSAKQKGYAET